jgi:membrane protein DedA with SNARE-associated domain
VLDTLLRYGSLPLLLAGLLAAGIGVPIPEDPLLLAAGVLSHRSGWPWWWVLAGTYAAVILADTALFAFARHFGDSLLRRWPFRRIMTPARLERVTNLLGRHGSKAIFVGRHLSGFRSVVFILAGIRRLPYRTFVLWDGLAGLITVPLMFGLGYLFSAHAAAVEADVARTEHWLAAVAGLVVLVWYWWWRRRSSTHRLSGPPKDSDSEGPQLPLA